MHSLKNVSLDLCYFLKCVDEQKYLNIMRKRYTLGYEKYFSLGYFQNLYFLEKLINGIGPRFFGFCSNECVNEGSGSKISTYYVRQ